MALTAALGVLLMFLGCALTFPGEKLVHNTIIATSGSCCLSVSFYRPALDVNWWGIFVGRFLIGFLLGKKLTLLCCLCSVVLFVVPNTVGHIEEVFQ